MKARFLTYGLLLGGLLLLSAQAQTGQTPAKQAENQPGHGDKSTHGVAAEVKLSDYGGSEALRSDEDREEIAGILQAQLTETVHLGMIAKQLHWTVTGPHFYGLHEQLDDVADFSREYSDMLAERMAALEVAPNGSPEKIVDNCPVEPVPTGFLDDDRVVQMISSKLKGYSERLNERIERLNDLDLTSQDILLGLHHKVDKYYWQFGVQLENRRELAQQRDQKDRK